MSNSQRHPADPLTEVAIDATRAGFRTLENVTAAVTESVRIRASEGSGRRRYAPRSSAAQRGTRQRPPLVPERPEPGDMTDHLLRIFADLLDRAGEVAQQIAEGIAPEQDDQPDEFTDEQPARVERVDVEAPAGAEATAEFTVHNTGRTVLRGVRFETSGLHSRGGQIHPEEVRFAPETVDAIPPGDRVTVSVSVAADHERPAADYHGLVLAQPGEGAVMLTVRSTLAR